MAGEHRALTWGQLLSRQYRHFTLTLIFSVVLHASNFFIFATLAPSVVFDVGGHDLLSWATTLFVVSTIVSAAAGGMFRAWLGSRQSLVMAAGTFALGSLATGLAPDMETVLAGRTVQGLGAGLLTSYSHGMIRELFPPGTWARMFAVVSGAWGVAAVSGPLIGGIFAEFDAWRWGFLTMVVAAGLFVLLVSRVIPEGDRGQGAGSAGQVLRLGLLGAGALVLGGIGRIPAAGADAALCAASLGCLGLAIVLEKRSPDRLFPRDMFRPNTVLGSGVLFVFGITFATVLTAVYGPLLFRVIHAVPTLTTGYIVTAQSMSWTLAAIVFSGLGHAGARVATVAGPAITATGVLITGLFLPAGPLWAAIAGIAVTGFGIGLAWGHVGRFLFEVVDESDGHRIGSVMPMTQSVGIAFGSSAAGVIASAAGLTGDLVPETAASVAGWLYAGLGPACLIALVGGLRVAMGTRPPAAGERLAQRRDRT